MESGLSSSARNKWEKEDIGDAITEMQEQWSPRVPIDAKQLKILSSGEYSQARRSIGESTNARTVDSSQPDTPIRSNRGPKFVDQDIFLSHSGKQKNFVRQLHRDLTNQGFSCFFDQDPESLPKGEDFPSRIFGAAKTCKVAVLLLSLDFIESKWPMLELSAFVEARDRTLTNPNLKILPLFFKISADALKNIAADNEKWKQLEKSQEKRAEWQTALNAIRRNNGLKFNEGDDKVKFRDEIVKEICHILPTPSPRYLVPCMQGQLRMCEEIADFFKSVHSIKTGTAIAGLYGIAGQGKTTLGKAFCNFKMRDFEGKVCHLEFSRGDSFGRIKLALQYLTCCSDSYLQLLTDKDQAQVQWYRRVKGQRVLLVLDNITEESIDEVMYYLKAELGEKSCILLSARSVAVMVKHLLIDKQSCMRVPSLEEEEAINILLERTSIEVSSLGAEDKAFALKCAHRCSFKEVSRRDGMFHPLALKRFGGDLFSKHGPHLSKWIGEIEGWVGRSGYGLDELLSLVGKAFDNMRPQYRTIFMLLTLYMPPNMFPHKVNEWLAVILNEQISFIEKAVEDLLEQAFIEESGPEIRIHDLYVEFAESKANEMRRWLWWKGDPRSSSTRGLISQHNEGFELARLEQCKHRRPSQIAPHHRQNLLVLQLVNVQNMSKVDLDAMGRLRSITIHKCKDLAELEGMAKLQHLAWVQIGEVNTMFKLPELSNLEGLQHLEINIAGRQVVNQLGDLTGCVFLREINVRCPSLLDFPKLNGLEYLEKVEFSVCDEVKGSLDCTGCVELRSIVIDSCYQMYASPILVGCKKVFKIVLLECDAVTVCPDVDAPSALETLELFVSSKGVSWPIFLKSCYGLKNLQLGNMDNPKELPSFRRLSNLTVLKLEKCGLREPPDLTRCALLEGVYFLSLEKLRRFPNFSAPRKLKKLILYNCLTVEDPPDISGCHELQLFHLVYNDNMKGLPNMRDSPLLEEIKISWQTEDKFVISSTDGNQALPPFHLLLNDLSYENQEYCPENLEYCLERYKHESFSGLCDVSLPEVLKEWEWLKGKTVLGKRYVRGGNNYCSIKAPYEPREQRKFPESGDPSGRVPSLICFIVMLVLTCMILLIMMWLRPKDGAIDGRFAKYLPSFPARRAFEHSPSFSARRVFDQLTCRFKNLAGGHLLPDLAGGIYLSISRQKLGEFFDRTRNLLVRGM